MKNNYFGTDGIRGRVGEEPMTPASVLKLGWAVGKVLASQGNREVLIGKDTRISGYMFESALEAGLSAAGVNSQLLGPMPTPAVAYLTRTFRAAAGIVISASHNPFYDNGLKFFSSDGQKLPDATESAIASMMLQPMETVDSANLGRAVRVGDAGGRYIEFCKSTFTAGARLDGIKIVVDSANGAAYDVAPRVFRELGAEVISIAADPDGLNINQECGSTSPDNLRAHVLYEKADVGIALDGDADRLIMVDNKGEVVDGDELLYIIAKARQESGESVHGVVGTLMTNLGLEHALRDLGISFSRAAVGDRYVLEQMMRHGWNLGGEASGHIICLDRTSTGDGTIAALQVLAYMTQTGFSLFDLKSGMTRYPQILLNVPLAKDFDLDECDQIKTAVTEAEHELGDAGRVLLRPSGTEPVVRVMVEGRVATDVEKICSRVADAVSDAVAGQTA
ncbi:MAG: phosphoglucosamine mutase [Pseudomonadota bacterium]